MSIERAVDCTGGYDTSYLNGSCRCADCKELSKEYRQRQYQKDVEGSRARLRESYARNAPQRREYRLKRDYGISKSEWYEILDSQGGVCAICRGGPDCGSARADSTFHVDHCHETGRVRGLLCSHCNRAIGLLKDSADIARAAAAYLD